MSLVSILKAKFQPLGVIITSTNVLCSYSFAYAIHTLDRQVATITSSQKKSGTVCENRKQQKSFTSTDESYSREELWSQRSNASTGGKARFLCFMDRRFIITLGKYDDRCFICVTIECVLLQPSTNFKRSDIYSSPHTSSQTAVKRKVVYLNLSDIFDVIKSKTLSLRKSSVDALYITLQRKHKLPTSCESSVTLCRFLRDHMFQHARSAFNALENTVTRCL